MLHPLHDGVHIALHEPAVVIVLLRELQVVFPTVDVRVFLDDVAFFDETVHLVRRVGLRDAEKVRELADRGAVHLVDDLHGERLHGAQRALALLHQTEQAAEKRELEFVIYADEVGFQQCFALQKESLFYSSSEMTSPVVSIAAASSMASYTAVFTSRTKRET